MVHWNCVLVQESLSVWDTACTSNARGLAAEAARAGAPWASRDCGLVAAAAAVEAVSSASTTAVAAGAAEASAAAAGAAEASRAAVAGVLAATFGGEKVDTTGAGLTAGAGGRRRCRRL